MIDNGIIELDVAGGAIIVRVFYTPNGVPSTEPLVNQGSPPHALEVINTTGQTVPLIITRRSDGFQTTINVPNGNPAITRTAAQMSALGVNTRLDAAGYTIQSP